MPRLNAQSTMMTSRDPMPDNLPRDLPEFPSPHKPKRDSGRRGRRAEKKHTKKQAPVEEPLDASEASLHLDFLTGELNEHEQPQEEVRPVDEEIYTKGAALSHKRTEHSSGDAKTLPTCSLTGSGSTFYEISIPTPHPESVEESYYSTEVKVAERSFHYSSSEQVEYEREFDPRHEYRGRPARDDRWSGAPSHNQSPHYRRVEPTPPRRERSPVQKTLSSNSRTEKRCSQSELASITKPRRQRSLSPRPPYSRQNSYRNPSESDVSVTVSVVSISRRGSAAEMASVTRPNDDSFSGRGGSPNASWVSRGECRKTYSKSTCSPHNSFRGSASPHNSFRREELTIQQQSSFRSRNGEQAVYESRSNSFRSTVREEIKVLHSNSGTISPKDLSEVLNNSFRRLNNSFKTCSEKGRSPHNSFRSRNEDMSGLLDRSLTLSEDYEGHYRRRNEQGYSPHGSLQGEEAAHTSFRSSGYNPHNSYRSQERPVYSRQNSYQEDRGFNPSDSYRSQRGVPFNPNNSYRSQREERPVHSRQSSCRGHDERSHCSGHNSFRSQRGEEHAPFGRHGTYPGSEPRSPHNSFRSRGEASHHDSQRGGAPFSRHGTYPGTEPPSPHGSFHSQRGDGVPTSPHSSFRGEGHAPFGSPGSYRSPEPRSPAHNRSMRSQGRPMFNRENSWKNSANEAQWRNRFEHNKRPNFPKEGSWRGGRPNYQRESSFDNRSGRPMYQRDSSFRSYYDGPEYTNSHEPRNFHDQEPSWAPSNLSGYTREQMTGACYGREEVARTASGLSGYRELHAFSSHTRETRLSGSSMHSREASHDGRQLPSRSKSDCGSRFSRFRHPSANNGRRPRPPSRSNSGMSDLTDISHGMDRVASTANGDEGLTMFPQERRLPPRSNSDFGGRGSRASSDVLGRRGPGRHKRDISDLGELSRGFQSVASSYSTRGGGEGEELLVEVFPGVEVPLRRAHETQDAISNNFYMPVSCMACSNMDLYAIADVAYFVCPACKSMCNVDDEYFNGRPVERHGLGLGFTSETLFCLQAEMMGASSPARAPAMESALRRCGTR